ncbi:MAG: glycosyl hydrolase family 43 [Actinomycetota bacterium]|nr:glycosyl hydrolase family 43 [Actinomycetota bacterium]
MAINDICYYHWLMNDVKGALFGKFIDHPGNPLLSAPFPGFLLADPTILLPGESPDGFWHLFANTLTGIHHFAGEDGIHWRRIGKLFPGIRPFIFKEKENYYLFYEQSLVPVINSRIVMRSTKDLKKWSKPRVILVPSLDWERGGFLLRTCGNPCVVRDQKIGLFRLYYSANLVFLPDIGFCEPLFIGMAESPKLEGPYIKREEPLISPSKENPYRNRGAGAIKVMFDEKQKTYYGFNNGIYTDKNGKSRSAIILLSSTDGVTWNELLPSPVIRPEGNGWKKALVYQLDVKKVGDEIWIWYNARSQWRFGIERIGLAISGAPSSRRGLSQAQANKPPLKFP